MKSTNRRSLCVGPKSLVHTGKLDSNQIVDEIGLRDSIATTWIDFDTEVFDDSEDSDTSSSFNVNSLGFEKIHA